MAREITPQIAELTDELVALGSTFTTIILHMSMCAEEAPDEHPIDVMLQRLVGETIAPLARRWDRSDVATCAAILRAAREQIGEDVVLVSPDWFPGEERLDA